jgi:hypothetical protein
MDLLERTLVDTLKERLGAGVSLTLTNNRRTLISISRRGGLCDVRLSRRFALADALTIDGLVSYLAGGARTLPRVVREFMNRAPSPELMRRKALKKLKSAGEVHNLADIAGEVNTQYFGGALSFRITWGKAPTKVKSRGGNITLGSYDSDLNLVRVHPALDMASVPRRFVEYIVYHELTHKKLGTRMGENGVRRVHDAVFREMERGFTHYEAARKWEKENIQAILRARRKLKSASADERAST